MSALIRAVRKARRGFTLILGLATLGILASSFLVPATDSAQLSSGAQTPRFDAAATSGRRTATSSVVFPVVYSANHRYLQDQNGQPFPILGRTSWAVVSLSVSDYQSYLDDTAAKGFNAIELWAVFSDNRCQNRGKAGDGSYPFTKRLDGGAWSGSFSYSNINNEAPDMTQPNEAYWAHLDGILTYAQSKGILCLLFPAYVGNGFDLDQGWGPISAANGGTKMTTYGAWIANRYKGYANIVWMLGGDEQNFSGPNLTAELGLLTGLQSISGQASTNFCAEWDGDSIYTSQSNATLKAAGTLQGAYTWNSVSQWCRNGYAATPAMPAFLLEGPYDQEGPDGTGVNGNATQPCRRFQWWSALSSIGGYMAGNGYTWPFNSGDWNTHLNTQTQQDNARLNSFINSIAWYTLVPSGLGGIGTLITAGGSTPASSDYVAAAADPAGTLLIAYVPPDHTGSITVDMTAMAGPAEARWYNPTTAAYSLISASIANTGTHAFTPPADNGSGYDDWLLVLNTAAPAPTPTPTPPSTPTPTLTPTPSQTPTSRIHRVVTEWTPMPVSHRPQ